MTAASDAAGPNSTAPLRNFMMERWLDKDYV
jgi:hypothetical protein